MRYDKTIYFVTAGAKSYDESTGDYSRAEPTREPCPASVMDTRTETMTLIYGKIRQGSLTIHIRNHHGMDFDWIEYDGKKYSVDYVRHLRTKDSYIVSEVQ